MNRKTGNFVTLLLSAALVSTVVAGVEAPFEIGKFENFCQGAVSHGFDDNMNTNPTAVEQTIFDDKKFHITLHVQTGSANWNNCKASFAKGHEISSHTVSHSSSNDGFQKSQQAIKTNVPGEKCVTVAYPDCQQNGANTLNYFIAGRNCDGQTNSTTPGKWDQISSKMFGGCSGCPNDANGLNSFADQAVTKKGWSVYCHHGIGSQSHNWATTNLNAMKSHLEYLDKNRDKIWCETFGNVARYIKERDAVSLAVKSSENTKITVTLTDNLPDSIYNYPLTVRRPLPDGWTVAYVSQKDQAIEDSIITVDSKKFVMFKAVPDGGDIVISSTGGSTYVDKRISENSTVNPVVINKSFLSINSASFSGPSISVSLFDLRGKLVSHYSYNTSTTSISVPLNTLANSAFVVKVTDGKTMVVNRCLSQM